MLSSTCHLIGSSSYYGTHRKTRVRNSERRIKEGKKSMGNGSLEREGLFEGPLVADLGPLNAPHKCEPFWGCHIAHLDCRY